MNMVLLPNVMCSNTKFINVCAKHQHIQAFKTGLFGNPVHARPRIRKNLVQGPSFLAKRSNTVLLYQMLIRALAKLKLQFSRFQ
jgi:hypothetical protein